MTEENHRGLRTYEESREEWIKQHPASVPVRTVELSPYPRWLKSATLLMFLAVSLLSAVHTIPVVYAGIPSGSIVSEEVRTAAANASIVAFELGILLSAFLMLTRRDMRLAYVLLGTMFAGILVANITSISQTYISGGMWQSVVSLVFGAGVPLIALVAGKLFVNIYNTERQLERQADERFRAELMEMDAKINAYHARNLKAEQAVKAVNLIKNNQISSRSKPSPRLQKALKWLEEHPGNLDTPPRELEQEIGVSYGTIYTAQRQLKANQNGKLNSNERGGDE